MLVVAETCLTRVSKQWGCVDCFRLSISMGEQENLLAKEKVDLHIQYNSRKFFLLQPAGNRYFVVENEGGGEKER